MEDFLNIPMIEQPRTLQINLYPHQLATVYKLEQLEKKQQIVLDREDENTTLFTNIGINGNKTGYGKTLEMITLILRDKMKWNLREEYIEETCQTFSRNKIVLKKYQSYPRINPTLILVGKSILHQWVNELNYTNLTYLVVKPNMDFCSLNIHTYDVILVTPNVYNTFVERYKHCVWKRFIFDEASDIRVPSMFTIKAGFIWLVTATPYKIYTQHRSCRTSFMYHIIGRYDAFYSIIDYLIIKNSDEFNSRSFEMPETQHLYYICQSPLYKALRNVVNPHINNLLSAGNISSVINYYGGKSTDNIIDLVQAKKKDDLQTAQHKINYWTCRNRPDKINKWTEKRDEIAQQLGEISQRFNEILNGTCPICQDRITKPVMEPGCQNIFCGKCIFEWFKHKQTCPLCRKQVDNQTLVYINTNETAIVEDKKEEEYKNKETTIINIIQSKPDGKFIIFSDWDETFKTIIRLLKDNNIEFIEAKGSSENREKSFELFRTGQKKVLFLNSNHNAVGINLQETTDIILYHKMHEQTQQQIIGRANRIGRAETLYVHHLLEQE